ncbi:hypothetical protein SAMN05216267_100123 [Actinacidiphila rubida]|uniref:Uncharacterized protein n=1 Tax=Actinacidiphila rubida TaxID=310780 RepID=A0A1H8DBK3_9ACTN|nr:hypothetical protein [Actinacidiphila rubida]SEN04653.1 hypothetical protein SAMN05216267_100123 [Actinacidiphila rubida]
MIDILAVIAVAVFVIGRQLLGEPLRGRRVLLLPAVLAVVGVTRLGGHGAVTPADVAFLAVGAVAAVAVGAGQGATMRLEHRDGGLWGRVPLRGLWWWAALVGARVGLTVLAGAAGAHLAASSAPIVLMLGLNRLGQAGVITLRAVGSGIPFAPEKDGRVFLADRMRAWPGTARAGSGRTAGGGGRAGGSDGFGRHAGRGHGGHGAEGAPGQGYGHAYESEAVRAHGQGDGRGSARGYDEDYGHSFGTVPEPGVRRPSRRGPGRGGRGFDGRRR